jgi:protoheme ferro-lyase
VTTRHLVLLTYGEPPTPAFLAQLRYSWRILLGLTRAVAPIPAGALPMIALLRARNRWRLWRAERYGSPLEPLTRAQAEGIEAALARHDPGTAWRVHVAYEFRDPLLTEVLDRLPGDQPVDVLPLYVADSAFTHQLSRAVIARWRRRARRRGAPVSVAGPLDEETYAELSARHVARQAAARGAGGPEWGLLLAAHGTLLEPPRPMETGRPATERVARAIAARLGGRFGVVKLGWLNHTYGGRWTEPAVEEALAAMAEAGCRRVLYYPFGFHADNAESQLEGRIALRGRPELASIHLPCLNDDPGLLEALARHVAGLAPAGAAAPGGAGAGPAPPAEALREVGAGLSPGPVAPPGT